MPRKLLNDVDGFTVDEYQGTFTGTFDVSGVDARHLAYDDEVLIVVRARVKPPRLKETRTGEIIRVNVLGVKEAGVVRSDRLKEHLCDVLGLEVPAPQLPFDETVRTKAGELDAVQEVEVADPVEEPELIPDDLVAEEELPVITETPVEVFSPDHDMDDPGPQTVRFNPDADAGPSRTEKRLVASTRDARLAAFLSE